MINKFYLPAIIILFLSGCTVLPDAIVTQVTSMTKVPTIIQSMSIPKTVTLTQTPFPRSPIEPTWTLPANLSSESSFLKINELFQTNGGCRLPCWWGITPGQTKWEDARSILFPLAFKIHDGQSKSGEFLAGLGTRYGIYEGKPTGFNQDYVIRDGIVQAIQIQLPYPIPSPTLKDILANYGIPNEVYLG